MAIFNLFKSKSKLGIDIGTSSIKITELGKEGGRFVLKNYGLFEFKSSDKTSLAKESGPIQNILKLPDGEIIWGIKEVLKKAKIKTTDVVASIPAYSTFATVIEMPYLSEQDLARSLPFEARKYIPVPLNEVVLDWSIIDIAATQVNATKPATVEVFLAAVPKEETLRYQRIMREAGLNLRALELENSALIRALLGNDPSPTAVVNIGGRSTSILIVNRGYERLSHNYEVGGFEVTRSIARSLNVSLEKAEDLKKKLGLKDIDENIINSAMKSLIDMMVFETKKTITNYEETKNQKVSRIILVGGLTNMPNFANYFQQKLGRNVYMGNALARIVYPQTLSSLTQEIASIFSVSIGLAMREV